MKQFFLDSVYYGDKELILDTEIGFDHIAEVLSELIWVFQDTYKGTLPEEILMGDRMFYEFNREQSRLAVMQSNSFQGVPIKVDPYMNKKNVLLKRNLAIGVYRY